MPTLAANDLSLGCSLRQEWQDAMGNLPTQTCHVCDTDLNSVCSRLWSGGDSSRRSADHLLEEAHACRFVCEKQDFPVVVLSYNGE
jgi:hypothetical protein